MSYQDSRPLQELISSYINDCINDRSTGFATDFGIGKMVSAHVYYHNIGEVVVTIRATKETNGFPINDPDTIIKWIYEKIK